MSFMFSVVFFPVCVIASVILWASFLTNIQICIRVVQFTQATAIPKYVVPVSIILLKRSLVHL